MKQLKILLVEDDSDDRQFFADALKRLPDSIALEEVENGAQCIEFLKKKDSQDIDFIFLDLNMPVMDGIECLEQIRQIPEFQELIIAIYSTSSSEKDIRETFEKGANVYLHKPPNFQELVLCIKHLIDTNSIRESGKTRFEHFILNRNKRI